MFLIASGTRSLFLKDILGYKNLLLSCFSLVNLSLSKIYRHEGKVTKLSFGGKKNVKNLFNKEDKIVEKIIFAGNILLLR